MPEHIDQSEPMENDVREELQVLDAALCKKAASKSFCSIFQTTPEQSLAKKLADLGNSQWNVPALLIPFHKRPKIDVKIDNMSLENDFPVSVHWTLPAAWDHAAFNLPSLLSQTISLMRPRALEEGLGFGVTFEGPIPRLIQNYPWLLRQILVNLTANALKFSESGTIDFRITEGATKRPNILLSVDLIDSRMRMTPELTERLFQPFAEGDQSIVHKFGGNGMHLIISRQLTNLLGGDVTALSQPCIGSTFTMTIDDGRFAGVEQLERLGESTLPRTIDQRVQSEIYRRGRILLAEDGGDSHQLRLTQLGSTGVSVVSALNERIAIDDPALRFDSDGHPNARDGRLQRHHRTTPQRTDEENNRMKTPRFELFSQWWRNNFGPLLALLGMATCLQAQTIDTTTGGAYIGHYGADGSLIANYTSAAAPSYAAVTMANTGTYTWTTSDANALVLPEGEFIASTYFATNSTNFTIDINLTDDASHKISVWLCDWDSNGPRVENVTVTNVTTGAILYTSQVSNFRTGEYISWGLSGHVAITATLVSGLNPIINAVFFDPSSVTSTVGPPGPQGIQGIPGPPGVPGKSGSSSIITGASGALDCVTIPGVCDVVTAIVPLKPAANAWTGANDFSAAAYFRLPSGNGVPVLGCSVAANVASAYVRADAMAKRSSLYVCAQTAPGVYAWELY